MKQEEGHACETLHYYTILKKQKKLLLLSSIPKPTITTSPLFTWPHELSPCLYAYVHASNPISPSPSQNNWFQKYEYCKGRSGYSILIITRTQGNVLQI